MRTSAMADHHRHHHREEEEGLRRGPWTVEEDLTLASHVAGHGEGRWNAAARAAGLRRTGKSCRLRWLNYLRPGVKRGDFSAHEQLLILDLHSRWGNRWSKIAAQLPGRTDNEIKNYWRTRVQKHARQLNCDAGSKAFNDAMRYLWMPRLAERAADSIAASIANSNASSNASSSGGGGGSPSFVSGSGGSSSSTGSSSLTSELGQQQQQRQQGLVVEGAESWVMQEVEDHEFWAAAQMEIMIQPPPEPQFIEDELISGWVQGFSDVIVGGGGVSATAGEENGLWSLDDIWKMQ